MRPQMEEPIEIGEELYKLKDIYESNLEPLENRSKRDLNMLIYYFEIFLNSHKKFEQTMTDLMNLNEKIEKIKKNGEDNEYC